MRVLDWLMDSTKLSFVLELHGITKAFGNNLAVDGVDFALERREIHTVLGENGAGKSTRT